MLPHTSIHTYARNNIVDTYHTCPTTITPLPKTYAVVRSVCRWRTRRSEGKGLMRCTFIPARTTGPLTPQLLTPKISSQRKRVKRCSAASHTDGHKNRRVVRERNLGENGNTLLRSKEGVFTKRAHTKHGQSLCQAHRMSSITTSGNDKCNMFGTKARGGEAGT